MAFSQSTKLGLQRALGCGRLVIKAFTASLHQAPQSASTGPDLAARRHASWLLSALSGFPKDLRYGPSAVRRKDGFGDDACFIARHSSADVVGVADGVGGWRTYGVDPSRFSRSLMKMCAQLVTDGEFEPHRPAQLIAASYRRLYQQCTARGKPMPGSSTACVVVLDRNTGCIHTANLGDSGFLVVRGGKVVHRSREQQHYFNAPYQLSLPPSASGSGFLSDSPESAETSSFAVIEGDLIVVATDGLFDNMPTNLIESELARLTPPLTERSVQAACNSLALQARALAMDQNHMSPFAQKAVEHGIKDAKGGKPDDITLILALVTTSGTLERVEEKNEK